MPIATSDPSRVTAIPTSTRFSSRIRRRSTKETDASAVFTTSTRPRDAATETVNEGFARVSGREAEGLVVPAEAAGVVDLPAQPGVRPIKKPSAIKRKRSARLPVPMVRAVLRERPLDQDAQERGRDRKQGDGSCSWWRVGKGGWWSSSACRAARVSA